MSSIDFDVYCSSCGTNLSADVNITGGRSGDVMVNVEPCPSCLKDSKQEGFDEGYEKKEEELECQRA
jgi:hypothetical protein